MRANAITRASGRAYCTEGARRSSWREERLLSFFICVRLASFARANSNCLPRPPPTWRPTSAEKGASERAQSRPEPTKTRSAKSKRFQALILSSAVGGTRDAVAATAEKKTATSRTFGPPPQAQSSSELNARKAKAVNGLERRLCLLLGAVSAILPPLPPSTAAAALAVVRQLSDQARDY